MVDCSCTSGRVRRLCTECADRIFAAQSANKGPFIRIEPEAETELSEDEMQEILNRLLRPKFVATVTIGRKVDD